MIQKRLRENLPRNERLCNFDAAYDLTKASTTHNHLHQPQRSVSCSSCNPKQEVGFLNQPPLLKS